METIRISTPRPYSAYKPSGVEWLGNVPARWEVRRLKQVSRVQGGFAFSTDLFGNKGVPVVRMNNIRRGILDLDNVVRIPEKNCKDAFALKVGDIIYGLSGSIGSTGSLGNYAVVRNGDTPSQLNQRIARFRPVINRITKEFLVWSLQTSVLYRQVLSHTTGTAQFNVSTNDIGNVALALPPVAEQRAIARFLDHADRHIQRYIRAKERLIELLKEQKQAIIYQAVTGQIDIRTGQPYPTYKDSGVEWLGEVPEHWDMIPLKRISRCIQNGATPPTAEPEYYENGTVPWYGPSSCGNSENVGHPVKHLNQSAFAHGVARLVRGPAILFVVIGATAGRMALMNEEGSTNQQITSYEIDSDLVDPRFILRHLRQAERWLRSTASSATLPILNSSILNGLKCAVPSLNEQELINRVLDSQIVQTDRSVLSASHQINLLLEYRTRLVADVVTGKIDVREAAVSLPQVDSPEFETGPVGGKEEEAS